MEAPFTQEQIDKLNEYQKSGRFHPYTCDRKSPNCETKLIPKDYSKDGILIAMEDSWICPCGEYKQNWAHD